MLAGAANLPAQASTTSTRTIMYGAAAAAAAFTLYNVEHKHQLATTVQGYLPNGGVVYADGHVALNGQTWYPGNSGQTVACNGQYCTINGNGNNGGYGYNNGGYGYSSQCGRRETALETLLRGRSGATKATTATIAGISAGLENG